MNIKDKSRAIFVIENLRLVESELFRLTSHYGVKTIEELDALVEKGRLSEEKTGEDLFRFDHLLSRKESLEAELRKLSISKRTIWTNLQDLLGLRKLNLQT